MVNFEKLLNDAKGKSIEYNGKAIFRGEFIRLKKKKCRVKYKIISTNSEWKQGIEINIKGSVIINNRKLLHGIRLWEDTAPSENVFEIVTKDSRLRIDNIWDHGDGVTQKWVNGSAMFSEEIENGKRYYCNDGHPDDDFNDLIFELTIFPEPETR